MEAVSAIDSQFGFAGHSTLGSLAAVVNPAQPWPADWLEDWYMVDASGNVQGPLPATEVFASGDSPRQFVSRRGFAQWYEARDFAGLWQSSRQLVDTLVASNQNDIQTSIDDTDSNDNLPEDDTQEIIRAFSLTGVDPAALMTPVGDFGENMLQQQPTEVLGNQAELEAPRMRWLARRGTQRLGKLTNPVIPALLTLATFGFAHVAWLLGSLREVVWHLDHNAEVNRRVRHLWMAWVPGLHLKTTWDLACLIRAMEEQDGYTSTSPVVAVMLGVFPPLSAIYLQHAMNDHWLVHCVV